MGSKAEFGVPRENRGLPPSVRRRGWERRIRSDAGQRVNREEVQGKGADLPSCSWFILCVKGSGRRRAPGWGLGAGLAPLGIAASTGVCPWQLRG